MKRFIKKAAIFSIIIILSLIIFPTILPKNETNIMHSIEDKHFRLLSSSRSKLVFIGGSNLLYGLDSENRLKALEPYYEGRLAKTLKEVESIANIEILFDRFIISEMAKYKDDPFTIGPMIYYYLLKLSEAQNIRLIYSNTNIELKNLI